MSFLFIMGFVTLWSLSLGFWLPWVKTRNTATALLLLWSVSAFALYDVLGARQAVQEYLSQETPALVSNRLRIQNRLMGFRRGEMFARVQLEQEPDRLDAKWHLYDVLASQALYRGEFSEALKHWRSALLCLEKENELKDHEDDKIRIKAYIQTVEAFKNR